MPAKPTAPKAKTTGPKKVAKSTGPKKVAKSTGPKKAPVEKAPAKKVPKKASVTESTAPVPAPVSVPTEPVVSATADAEESNSHGPAWTSSVARRLTLRGGPIPTGHIVGSKSASLQRLIHVHAGLGLDEEWLPALHAFVQSLRTLCAHVGVPAWQDNRRALIEREGIKANDAVQVYNVH